MGGDAAHHAGEFGPTEYIPGKFEVDAQEVLIAALNL